MTQPRVALVSGGTKGIGRAITERLLNDGWSVLATFLNDSGAAQALVERHPQLAVMRSNLASTAECADSVDTVLELFGRLDHLVVAAGIAQNALVRDTSDDEWDLTISTNLSGPFRLARAAIAPITASEFGRVVIVSSVASLMGNAGQAAYAASKAGLVGLTKSLARELALAGTTVNLVIPGPTANTGMTVNADPQFVSAIERKIPMRRLGRPEEVAFAVRSLLDDLAGFTTGTALIVDGGLSM